VHEGVDINTMLPRRDLSLQTFLAGIYGMNFDNLPELHWVSDDTP
jgi:hypothetical protein